MVLHRQSSSPAPEPVEPPEPEPVKVRLYVATAPAADASDTRMSRVDETDEDETTASIVPRTFSPYGAVRRYHAIGRRVQLATRVDALFTRTTADGASGLAPVLADVHRLRLIMEGSRVWTGAEDRTVTPAVEVGLRHDWGDTETGLGPTAERAVHGQGHSIMISGSKPPGDS